MTRKKNALCNSQANSGNSKPTISLSIFFSVSESNGPDSDGTFFPAHAYDSPIRVSVRGIPSPARALMMLAMSETASLPSGEISCECNSQNQFRPGVTVGLTSFWLLYTPSESNPSPPSRRPCDVPLLTHT